MSALEFFYAFPAEDREAKVDELDISVLVQQYVLELDVSMADEALVQVRERADKLRRHGGVDRLGKGRAWVKHCACGMSAPDTPLDVWAKDGLVVLQ